MNSIIEKTSAYDLLVNLVPGSTFLFLLKYLYQFDPCFPNLLVATLFFYFAGICISRFGSLTLGKLFKKSKYFAEKDYKEFVEASKLDKKIEVLSVVREMYRSIAAMLILTILVKPFLFFYNRDLEFSFKDVNEIFFLMLIAVLFLLSYKEQTQRINIRIDKSIDKLSSQQKDM